MCRGRRKLRRKQTEQVVARDRLLISLNLRLVHRVRFLRLFYFRVMASFFRNKKPKDATSYVMANDTQPTDDVPLLAFEATAPPQYSSHEVLMNEVTATVKVEQPAVASGQAAASVPMARAQDLSIHVHNSLNNVTFSGNPFEDIEQFFREWEAMLGTTKLESTQHLDKLGTCLKKTAKHMYWARRLKEPTVSLAAMKQFLIDNFRPKRPGLIYRSAAENRVQLPGELVADYSWDKYALIQKIDPTPSDKEAIQMVLRGLRSQPLVSALYGEEFSDFMEFYNKLKLKAEGMAFAQAGSMSAQPEAAVLLADGEVRPELQKWIPRVSANGEKALQKQSRNRRQLAWNEKGEPRCFNCNEYGHMSKECKKEKVQKKSGNDQRGGQK